MGSLLSSSSYRFVGNGNVVSDLYLLRFLVLCFNVGLDWETIVIDMNSEISPISCGNVCQMKK
ncbi:hypothetical protein HID58_025571 [Brassica napus]|uniref:Uncharacterized protein n=1 Tax=Brassica napus TaxID=3708 RepID=A0ABQ8CLJ9_BRANA|nr:hypothetical protein HID58_025571 [Brassica napus]